MRSDSAPAGKPWRQARAETGSARGSRRGGSRGDEFSRRDSDRAWSSMIVHLILQFAILPLALALAARMVSAEPFPQDKIASEIDAQGRWVYINADPAAPSSAIHNLPGMLPSRVVPDGMRRLVGDTARAFAVDPKLVDAVVQVESGYNAHAVSPKGAMGLMQLIPSTAARLGVQNPFDPAENVRGGVTYLSDLLKRFDGNVPLSLAAYNAGEGAVLRHGGIPPFAETQDYVRKVTTLYPVPDSVPRPAQPEAAKPAAASPGLGGTRPLSNAPSPAPIYQYVDEQGVIHFTQ